jgi:hypothetical protein
MDLVVELVWSNDLESSASDSVATGRVSRVKEVEGNDQDKQAQTGPPDWGVMVSVSGSRYKSLLPKQCRGYLAYSYNDIV